MSGPGPLPEAGARNRQVRFPPDSDQTADITGGPARGAILPKALYSGSRGASTMRLPNPNVRSPWILTLWRRMGV
jgi:hypothetical protein